jgi:hypothetical protein
MEADKTKCSICGGGTKAAVINLMRKEHLWILNKKDDGDQFAPQCGVEYYVCTQCGHIDLYAADKSVFQK